ncbi:MAG: anion permease [Candidatus Methanofishera endochildressiae]|uniref:Anion permease n=1 Tax=Candidatus Methanofishera endochildressiae TaxID=2738884 RepID=A0A7Z0SFA8_9GAMM|nr:anion permease [Candidatus Methanofishera endochildressiae]
MEKWDLHKRIALFIIRLIGGGPDRIILGFMLASAFLSMWISNRAFLKIPFGPGEFGNWKGFCFLKPANLPPVILAWGCS